jgi:hypothetical protein
LTLIIEKLEKTLGVTLKLKKTGVKTEEIGMVSPEFPEFPVPCSLPVYGLVRISLILINSSCDISPLANLAFKIASESIRSWDGPFRPGVWNLKIRIARNTIKKRSKPHNSMENKLPGKKPLHQPSDIGP